MLEAYRKHVAERAEQGIVPKPLDAEQVAALVELLKNPPKGEEAFILDLISDRVPAGVDEAAYVKAGFLTALANGSATSPIIDKALAVRLLGTMLGGYNIVTLVKLLDDSTLAPLAALAGVQWVNLQINATPSELEAAAQLGLPLMDPSAELSDFADTAALVCALDLVITVDTAVAHLAGALGRPAWVLLPFVGCDWRWLRDRDDSPWYDSLRLYRQPKEGDWASVIAAVTRDIQRQLLATTDASV